MEVRYVQPNEAVDYLKVSAASFIWKFNAEEDKTVEMPVLAAFHENQLIAGVEIFDFRFNFCGNILNAVVPSGVCSRPDCRRMGGVRAVFDEIGRTALENDWVVGFLHPFSIAYYEKFGYANLNRMFSVTVQFENLKDVKRNTDVILYDGSQIDELCALHNECAMLENLMTLREDKKHFCDTPLEKADYTYFRRNTAGKADGYVRFSVNRPNEVVVDELFVLSPDALYGLIGFLRNYDGIAKTLTVRNQYQGSPFFCFADRIDGAVYASHGGVAARIYNVRKLLENNLYPNEYGKFRLMMCDELDLNSGVFEVEYSNGKGTVKRIADENYDIALTPAAAARLMLAGEGHCAHTASYIDGVDIAGNADDFFRAFPHRVTRFLDSCWSV